MPRGSKYSIIDEVGLKGRFVGFRNKFRHTCVGTSRQFAEKVQGFLIDVAGWYLKGLISFSSRFWDLIPL